MKMPLLYALLAAAVLAAPAMAQDSGAKHPDSAAGAPDAQPAKGGDSAGGGAKQEAEAGKLPVVLQKGGAVVFQPDAKAKQKMKVKYKFKGYTKGKGSLEKYKQSAKEKRLDKGAVEALEKAKQQKAEDLAAQAEMNEDVQQTVKAKLEAAKAAGKDSEEAKKFEAAAEAAKEAEQGLAKQMEKFERDDAAGKKVFKHPEAGKQPQ